MLRRARRHGFTADDFTGVAVLALAFGALAGRRAPAGLEFLEQTGNVVSLLVWLALLGTKLDRSTVLCVGWFGPRGLASLVFALLALEALGSVADEAVALVAATVLLSVVVHGLSAGPLARRYGQTAAAAGPEPGGPVPVTPCAPRATGHLPGSPTTSCGE